MQKNLNQSYKKKFKRITVTAALPYANGVVQVVHAAHA
jgi:hypothetical protein